jgi:hypothetical protein
MIWCLLIVTFGRHSNSFDLPLLLEQELENEYRKQYVFGPAASRSLSTRRLGTNYGLKTSVVWRRKIQRV